MDGQTDRPLLPLSITRSGTLRYGQRKARSVQTQRPYNFLQFPVPPGSGPRSRLTPLPLACPLQPHGLAPASGLPSLSLLRALCLLRATWLGASPPAEAGSTVSFPVMERPVMVTLPATSASSFPPGRPPQDAVQRVRGAGLAGVTAPEPQDSLWGIVFAGDPPWVGLPLPLLPARCSEAKPSLTTERKSRK